MPSTHRREAVEKQTREDTGTLKTMHSENEQREKSYQSQSATRSRQRQGRISVQGA
jgi:hypothetical protein